MGFVSLGAWGFYQAAPKPTLPFYQGADWTPRWLDPQGTEIHQVADFSLTNQAGKIVNQKEMAGKIYVASFFFTSCPSVCPNSFANLKKVQAAFVDDSEVFILSHSVQPEVDTVERLSEYADARAVDLRTWYLLTGDKAQLYQLARQSYFADEDLGPAKGPEDFLHSEKLVLVDSHRRLRGVYNATVPIEVRKLIEDIKILKREG